LEEFALHRFGDADGEHHDFLSVLFLGGWHRKSLPGVQTEQHKSGGTAGVSIELGSHVTSALGRLAGLLPPAAKGMQVEKEDRKQRGPKRTTTTAALCSAIRRLSGASESARVLGCADGGEVSVEGVVDSFAGVPDDVESPGESVDVVVLDVVESVA
jgi:hypothetical protein